MKGAFVVYSFIFLSFELEFVLELQTSQPYIVKIRPRRYFLRELAYLVLLHRAAVEELVLLYFRTFMKIGLEITQILISMRFGV